MIIDKKYQKKKKLKESEVTSEGVMQPHEVEMLLKTITQYEQVLYSNNNEEQKSSESTRDSMSSTINPSSIQHLISLYNKAIEYYSVINDQRLEEFLKKLKNILLDEKMQKILET